MKNRLLCSCVMLLIGCIFLWNCSDDENSPLVGKGNSIVSFVLTTNDGSQFTGYITDTLIEIAVPLNVDLKDARIDYSLSEYATITPDPTTITNWENPLEFVVTSYNQSAKRYMYRVKYTDVVSEGNVVLTTQASVDTFAGLRNSIISGSLIIGSDDLEEEDPVTDLSGLELLTEVKGEIAIKPSFAGTSLNGLENVKAAMSFSVLEDTQKEFDVDFPNLENLGGINVQSNTVKSLLFPKVTEIGVFSVQAAVQTMDFSSLRQAFNGISFYSSAIETIDFPQLTEITGDLKLNNPRGGVSNGLKVVNCPNLKAISGNMDVSFHNDLQSIDFSALETVNELKIEYCDQLSECIFPNLVSAGRFAVNWHKNIKKISAPKLETTGYFGIGGEALETIEFPVLRSCSGGMLIMGSGYSEEVSAFLDEISLPALEETSSFTISKLGVTKLSFPQLKTISSRFSLQNVRNLASVDLSQVSGITEYYFTDCPELQEIKSPRSIADVHHECKNSTLLMKYVGLEEITNKLEVVINNEVDVVISDVKKINTLTIQRSQSADAACSIAFPDLVEVGTIEDTHAQLRSFSAPQLTRVTGRCAFIQLFIFETFNLPKLESIGGDLLLSSLANRENPLKDLNGWSTLKSVGGKVEISNLTNLTDFAGVKNIVGTMSAENWSVTNCAYNPTLNDMKNGKYTEN